MRKLLAMLLTLSLLAPFCGALADGPVPYTSDEMGFTTMIDPAWRVEWRDGQGVYFHFGDDNIPYILLSVNTGANRIRDGRAALEEQLPALQESYSQNGSVSTHLHGSFTVGGREVAAADVQYRNSDGLKIYLLSVFDVRDDCTILYNVRYLDESQRQQMLDGLDLIGANLRLSSAGDAPASDGPVPYVSQEMGFETMMDPAWRVEWREGQGVYFRFGDDNIPYILLSVNTAESRIRDGRAALEEQLPALQEKYSQNGAVSTSLHGSFTVGGREVAAADMQYRNSDGLKIYLLSVFDVRDDCTILYNVRYLDESQRQQMLDGLDLIGANLRLTAAAAPAPQANPAPADSADAGVYSLALTDIVEQSNALGRCAAPKGAKVSWNLSICSTDESYSNPCHVSVAATTDDGIIMLYSSMRDYLSAVDDSTPDGQFNTGYYTPMLHYMDASDYCDYLAANFGPADRVKNIRLIEENSFPELRELFDQLEKKEMDKGASAQTFGLLTTDKAACTMCSKRYAFDFDGVPSYLTVLTGTLGVWYTAHGYAANSWIAWQAQSTYIMTCPADKQALGDAAFSAFVGNTSVSDQFEAANEKMANALWERVAGTQDLLAGKSYSEKVLREETADGDDYEDQFSDYIFDQNDYTLSNGDHVKVSTAYDYVYEGDNGTVYYSNSAFAPTNGGTQLYPNG